MQKEVIDMGINNVQSVKKAKNGILSIFFSRTVILLMLLAVQLVAFSSSLTFLKDYATYIQTGFLLLGVFVVIHIINSKSNSSFKITWILLIMIAPIFGSAFYGFMKMQFGTKYLKRRLAYLDKCTKPYLLQDQDVLEDLRASKPANANLVSYMTNQISFPIYRNTSVMYFPCGEEKFMELKRQLREAEHYIFMEYFIIEKGIMWNEILDILKEKVWEGVDVRVM